ncbi:MAG: phosphoglycerate dehydrogenase [Pseudomonadota bacterium]
MTDAPAALLVENVHPDADAALQSFGAIAVERRPGSPERSALFGDVAGADILGIRSRTQVDAELLDAAVRLQAVGCFCIGTNQVDLDETARRGIPVFNAPFGNTRSVAELTIASVIMLMRRIPEKMFAIEKGQWLKTADGAYEVRKKKLGIIGYGNIGAQLSVIASALGMHVFYHDIEPKLAHGNARAVDRLDTLLGESDIVTLHVPATSRTRNMIGRSEISRMKPGAVLINQARGDLVDVDALADALKSGHLAGAAVDVFPKEPKSKDEAFESPLIGCPNVILTPHIGGSTAEAQAAIGEDAAIKLARFIHEGSTSRAVNFPEVDPGPIQSGRTRLIAPHRNAPGYLRALNDVASSAGANVASQFLQTKGEIGYAVTDLEGDLPAGLLDQVRAINGTIRARLIAAPV